MNRNRLTIPSVLVLLVLVAPFAEAGSDCPTMPYDIIPFGGAAEIVLAKFQEPAQCKIEDGGEPEGLLRTKLWQAFDGGTYKSTDIFGFTTRFLHPQAYQGYHIRCECWESIEVLTLGFTVNERGAKTLLLIEKAPKRSAVESSSHKDHYAYFSELINKVVGREGQKSTSLYIKNVYENTVLDSTIGVWNDKRKNIMSYLIVAESSFIASFVSDEIIGHLAISEWEKYAPLADLAFVMVQEEKKRKQGEKASEAKSGGEF